MENYFSSTIEPNSYYTQDPKPEEPMMCSPSRFLFYLLPSGMP